MEQKSTMERLKVIIQHVAQRKGLDSKQTNAIVSLVEEVHKGGTLTNDYLIGIFENIGGV
tara:strand:- start:863 stop:1042 length:180 start_codon:yes stop_codon:yes gene_type:complete